MEVYHFDDKAVSTLPSPHTTKGEHYRVTEQVINIRLNSLAYEIDQYRSGTSLDCLELLSRRQCKKRGITTSSYLALCDFSLDWNAAIESFEQMPERIHI